MLENKLTLREKFNNSVRNLGNYVYQGLGDSLTKEVNLKTGAQIATVAIASTCALACDDPPNPPNNPPIFPVQPFPDFTEGVLSGYQIHFLDEDNSTVIITKEAGADCLAVQADGYVWGTPIDDDVGPNSLTVRATDTENNSTTETFNFNINNISTLSGTVKDMYNGADIPGANIDFGNYSTTADGFGTFTLNIPDGLYNTTITAPDYTNHYAGLWIVNHQAELDNKTHFDFKLIEDDSDFKEFIDECIRGNGSTKASGFFVAQPIRKWDNCPEFIVYLKEFTTGDTVNQSLIDIPKDIIQNELWKVDPLFTTPTYNENDSLPVAGFDNGTARIGWEDVAGIGGYNGSLKNNNTIIACFAYCDPATTKRGWIQELSECVVGQGESNKFPSVFNDPSTQIDYTQYDLKLFMFYQNRPKGNKDNTTTGIWDSNPVQIFNYSN